MAFGLPSKDAIADGLDYTIHVTKRQLRLIQNSLEEYFRLRMGQTFDLSDDLAFQHYEYKRDDPEFDERITRRDDGQILLDNAMKAFAANDINHWHKTKDVEVAIDMWHVIRHFFWEQQPQELKDKYGYTTDAGPVYVFGEEPMIGVEKVSE